MSSCLTWSMVCFSWTSEHLSHWFPQPPFSADWRAFILPFCRPVNGLSHWVILKTQFFSMDCQDFWNEHHTWLRTKFKRPMDKAFLLKEIQLRSKFPESGRKNWVLNSLVVYVFFLSICFSGRVTKPVFATNCYLLLWWQIQRNQSDAAVLLALNTRFRWPEFHWSPFSQSMENSRWFWRAIQRIYVRNWVGSCLKAS